MPSAFSPDRPICLDCGYDLAGVPPIAIATPAGEPASWECPECGTTTTRAELLHPIPPAQLRESLVQLRTIRIVFLVCGAAVAITTLGRATELAVIAGLLYFISLILMVAAPIMHWHDVLAWTRPQVRGMARLLMLRAALLNAGTVVAQLLAWYLVAKAAN